MKHLMKFIFPVLVIAMLFTACTKEVNEVANDDSTQVATEMASGMDLTAEQIQALQNARAEVPAELQEAIDKTIENVGIANAAKLPPTDPCHTTTADAGFSYINAPSSVGGMYVSYYYVDYWILITGPGYVANNMINDKVGLDNYSYVVPLQTGTWNIFVFVEEPAELCEDIWILIDHKSKYVY